MSLTSDHFPTRVAGLREALYNGSIPRPTLKVQEGWEVVVNVENVGDIETTVHWHGLRLENRYDGTHQGLGLWLTRAARFRL